MFKTGMLVEEYTRKVGQIPRRGTVKAVHPESVEVTWEDGHTSIVSRQGVHPVKTEAKQ